MLAHASMPSSSDRHTVLISVSSFKSKSPSAVTYDSEATVAMMTTFKPPVSIDDVNSNNDANATQEKNNHLIIGNENNVIMHSSIRSFPYSFFNLIYTNFPPSQILSQHPSWYQKLYRKGPKVGVRCSDNTYLVFHSIRHHPDNPVILNPKKNTRFFLAFPTLMMGKFVIYLNCYDCYKIMKFAVMEDEEDEDTPD